MSEFYQEKTRARLPNSRISESDKKRVASNVNLSDVWGDVNTAETINNYHYYNVPVPEQAVDAKAFESYHEQFKSWLKKETKKLCSYSNLPGVKEPVEIVPLQLSSSVHHWSNDFASGHYHHRKEVSEMLNNPIVGDVQSENFFKESKKYAEHSAESKQFEFQEAKEEYINQVGNFVGIAGEAGMGKTTLTKQLLQQALDKDKPLYNAEYVFYVPFRNLNYKKETDFLHFLIPGSLPSKFTNNHNMMDMLLDELNDCDNVCLIMDGFDEADLNLDSTCESKVDVHDSALAEDFINNLLQGKIFSKAKKIISSRPRQLYEIDKKFCPNYVVNILGLDLAAQKLICQNVCKEQQKEVFLFIQNHPDLLCMCCVPFNCIMICLCVKTILKRTKTKGTQTLYLLNSLTCILTIVHCRFMHSEHVRENLAPEKLATLAWNGLINKKLRFDENDLLNAGLKDAKMNTYLVTLLEKDDLPLLEGLESKFTFFSHLIVQEFHSALKILFFMSFDEFLQLLEKHDIIFAIEFEIVSKFLFGLLNKHTFKYLEKSGSISCHYPTKQEETLKSMLLQEVVNWCPFFLKICHLVYEMRDDKFCEEIAEKMNSYFSITGKLLPSDVVAFCYVLQFRKSSLILELKASAWFVGESLKIFFESIKPIFVHSVIEHIGLHIDLSYIFPDCDMCPYYYREQSAFPGYEDFGLKPAVWTALWSFLETTACPIQTLNLFQNPIDYNILSRCLSNVQELLLVGCLSLKEDVKKLSVGIQALSSPLKRLDLSYNSIKDQGISALKVVMCNIQELNLIKCGIKSSGMKLLATALRSLHTPMKRLDISGNDISDVGLRYITVQFLENVEELCIIDTSVSSAALKFLSDQIEKLRKPLKILQVSLPCKSGHPFSKNIGCLHIDIISERTDFLIPCSRITELARPLQQLTLCTDCRVTSSLKCSQEEDGLQNHLNFFLTHCKLIGNVFLICGCLQNIDEVVLKNINSEKSLAWVINGIIKRKSPLKRLELHDCFNDTFDFFSGLDATCRQSSQRNVPVCSHTISSIEELALYGRDIGTDDMRPLATSINLIQKPMKLFSIIGENINDGILQIVCSCLHKFERLVIICEGEFGFDLMHDLELLLTTINKLTVPLKELQMDGISDDSVVEIAARKLQKFRSKIINLKLNGSCIFSSEGYVFYYEKKIKQRTSVTLSSDTLTEIVIKN